MIPEFDFILGKKLAWEKPKRSIIGKCANTATFPFHKDSYGTIEYQRCVPSSICDRRSRQIAPFASHKVSPWNRCTVCKMHITFPKLFQLCGKVVQTRCGSE